MSQPQQIYSFSNNKIVKTILLSTLAISTGSFVTNALPAGANPPTNEQANAPITEFYCGIVKDPSSHQELPATIAKVAGLKEDRAVIVWKSERFPEFTPQRRCEIVSPKFQAAIQAGRYQIVAGTDKESGLGIICALTDASQPCDLNSMVFTLKSYQDADITVGQISSMIAGEINKPTWQSGGKRIVDLRDLARPFLRRRVGVGGDAMRCPPFSRSQGFCARVYWAC